jgi:carbon monoxide dehydrogenase subunit G
MNLQGERIIPASVERTWLALNDPQTLKACIAGCESIETTGENQFLATMAVRIGPVNAKFKGKLQLSDIVPMQSYRINFDGQGGVAGFGKGTANVTLAPVAGPGGADGGSDGGDGGEATKLNYTADAQVGGKIAQIGSRLVESAAAKIAADFFKAFEARMTDPVDPVSPVNPAAAAPPPNAAPDAMARSGLPAQEPRPAPTIEHVASLGDGRPQVGTAGAGTVWWIAGIIILAVLAYFFTR